MHVGSAPTRIRPALTKWGGRREQHDGRALDLHVVSHTPGSSLINTHSFNDQYWIVDENMH